MSSNRTNIGARWLWTALLRRETGGHKICLTAVHNATLSYKFTPVNDRCHLSLVLPRFQRKPVGLLGPKFPLAGVD